MEVMVFPMKHHIWKFVLVSSLLSPLALLSSNLNPWRGERTFAFLVQEIIFPIEIVWHSFNSSIANIWHHYLNLTEAAKQNTELRREIKLLRTQLLNFKEQKHEIKRLRKILGFAQNFGVEHKVAEVISSAQKEPFYTLRIGKGENDGVKVGMAVVTASGVVGRIIRTGYRFSDVQLLIDANFNTDVLLQRTRVRGVLKGILGSYCLLKLNRRAEIRIGDTIITSGIVGGFPKGLPVGRVVRISYESDNISQTITVEPWVDYQRVEEVIVLLTFDPEMQKIAEAVGRNWLTDSLGGGHVE